MRQPSPNEERTRLDRIDAATGGQPQLAPPPLQVPPPTFGAPKRDAVNAIVDQIVSDACGRIDELQEQLEQMKNQILVGAASAKGTLHEQVDLCARITDETKRIGDVMHDLRKVLRL